MIKIIKQPKGSFFISLTDTEINNINLKSIEIYGRKAIIKGHVNSFKKNRIYIRLKNKTIQELVIEAKVGLNKLKINED